VHAPSFSGPPTASTPTAAATPGPPSRLLSASLRRRWPSITCTHDLGAGPGPAGLGGGGLARADTAASGDVFQDAAEAFSALSSGEASVVRVFCWD
jgi:hypothetical protein